MGNALTTFQLEIYQYNTFDPKQYYLYLPKHSTDIKFPLNRILVRCYDYNTL